MKLSDLYVALGFNDTKFKRGIRGAQYQTKTFSNQISKLGGVIAGAFAVQSLTRFGSELVELGGKAEGVRTAFKHIADPALLNDLRRATRGAVDDLTLMGKAVQAKNFQIPLENLSSLLEFASARAVQTGESVEYLTNSIILGIGRKSPLILDNLGISAVRLREELKGAGVEMTTTGDVAAAVGRIAQQEMLAMGDVADTAGTKIQRLTTTWMNMKTTIGEIVAPVVGEFMESINSFLKGLDKYSGRESVLSDAIKLDREEINGDIKAAEQLYNALGKTLGQTSDMSARNMILARMDAIDKLIPTLGEEETSVKELTEAELKLNQETEKIIANVDDLVNKTGEQFDRALSNYLDYIDILTEARKQFFEHDEEIEEPFNYIDIGDGLKEKEEAYQRFGDTINAVNDSIAASALMISKNFTDQEKSWVSFVATMAVQTLRLIAMYQGEAMARSTANATISASATGPGAIFAQPAFIAAGIASIMSIFASIPKFATGGIVQGGSFSGDNMLIRANSGEMILNQGQQANLFKMINSGANMNITGQFIAKGGDLIAVIDRTNKVRKTVR